MPFTLEGRTAVVTGAGRGIGQAIARKLGGSGARVLVTDLEAALATETARLIQEAGGTASVLAGDLTDPRFPQALVDTILATFGSIDIIVNNAGFTWDNVIHKTSDEQFQALLEIHVVAPFRLLRAAAPWIREAARREDQEGRRVMRKVVNVTSISAEGNAGQVGYSAGKSGVIGLTRSLAKEWGRYHVNVNAVGFGLMETRLIRPLADGNELSYHGRRVPIGIPDGVCSDVIERARQSSPLGRLGTPEDAAGAVLFFCSPLSDYVTGEVLMCSGGQHF